MLHGFLPQRNGDRPEHHCAKRLHAERDTPLRHRLLEERLSVLSPRREMVIIMMNNEEIRLSCEVFSKYGTPMTERRAKSTPYTAVVMYEHPLPINSLSPSAILPGGVEQNFIFYSFYTEAEACRFVRDSYHALLNFDKENGIRSEGEIATNAVVAWVWRYFTDRTDVVGMSVVKNI